MYWLDYSAKKLPGAVIKAAGYGGVIRYIDSPDRLTTKHTNLAEYRDHRAHGLGVRLVMQTTTTASDGGFPAGVDHARRALAGATYLDNYAGPIFFTNDRTVVPNAGVWRAYLDGAASVLGKQRVGAYGFANAMDLAIGHATWYWQAGRWSDVRAHAHLWQDNNFQPTVGGIATDRNLILKTEFEEDDVALTDDDIARIWAYQIRFPALPANPGGPASMHLANANLAAQQVNGKVDALSNDEANIITAVRDIVATDADTVLTVTPAQIQELAAALVAALPPGATPEQVQDAVRAAFARGGAA